LIAELNSITSTGASGQLCFKHTIMSDNWRDGRDQAAEGWADCSFVEDSPAQAVTGSPMRAAFARFRVEAPSTVQNKRLWTAGALACDAIAKIAENAKD